MTVQLETTDFSFGLKLNFTKRKDANINYAELRHTEEGHNKFYTIRLVPQGNLPITHHVVIITFGKISTGGGEKVRKFKELTEAYKFINKKLEEKIRKGYKRIK